MRKRKEKVDVKRRLFLVWCYLKRLYKNYEFGRKLQYKDTNDWQ